MNLMKYLDCVVSEVSDVKLKWGKIIESSDNAYSNLYQYCNFNWFPLKRGMNKIRVTGSCILDFICEFPVDCGG